MMTARTPILRIEAKAFVDVFQRVHGRTVVDHHSFRVPVEPEVK